jgi:hypothetical protein
MQKKKSVPSKRSQMIYCRVMIEGRSVEQVAKDLFVTTPTVKSIVARVKRWMKKSRQSVPDEEFSHTAETLRQLHLARLEHQWEQTMNAWYRSTHDEETQRLSSDESGKKKVEKLLKTQTGDISYLVQAREILQEIRELVGSETISTAQQESHYVEGLSIEQRTAAVNHLLETLGRRAGAEEAGGTDFGSRAAA